MRATLKDFQIAATKYPFLGIVGYEVSLISEQSAVYALTISTYIKYLCLLRELSNPLHHLRNYSVDRGLYFGVGIPVSSSKVRAVNSCW